MYKLYEFSKNIKQKTWSLVYCCPTFRALTVLFIILCVHYIVKMTDSVRFYLYDLLVSSKRRKEQELSFCVHTHFIRTTVRLIIRKPGEEGGKAENTPEAVHYQPSHPLNPRGLSSKRMGVSCLLAHVYSFSLPVCSHFQSSSFLIKIKAKIT